MQETTPTNEEQSTSSTTEIATVSQPEDNNIDIVEDIADTTEEEDNYRCTYSSKRSRRSSDQIKIMIFHNEDEAKKFLLENENLLSFSCSPMETLTESNATQSIPKKEGKIKTFVSKAGKIVSSLKNQINSVIHSQIVKDLKDSLVSKLKMGIKKALGSDVAKSLEKQIVEHGKDFTNKVGNALINKGVVILAGSAIAGK